MKENFNRMLRSKRFCYQSLPMLLKVGWRHLAIHAAQTVSVAMNPIMLLKLKCAVCTYRDPCPSFYLLTQGQCMPVTCNRLYLYRLVLTAQAVFLFKALTDRHNWKPYRRRPSPAWVIINILTYGVSTVACMSCLMAFRNDSVRNWVE